MEGCAARPHGPALSAPQAFHVLLRVAQIEGIALWSTVVVFLLGFGHARLGFLELGFQNGACIRVASTLVIGIYARRRWGRSCRLWCCTTASASRTRALDHGDVSALHHLAVALFGHRNIVGVFIAAAVDAVLRERGRYSQCQAKAGRKQGESNFFHRQTHAHRAQHAASIAQNTDSLQPAGDQHGQRPSGAQAACKWAPPQHFNGKRRPKPPHLDAALSSAALTASSTCRIQQDGRPGGSA